MVQAEYGAGVLEGWKEFRKKQLDKTFVRQAAARSNAFSQALYGKGHPHVRQAIDDPKKLRALTLREIEDFRAKHYRAANTTLIVTGGFDLQLTLKYIESFFGAPVLRDARSTWNQPKQTAKRLAAPEPRPGAIRHFTEIDGERAQTDVTIAYPLATAYGKDHAALAVMADMLNFAVSAVRQTLGASYGVYARLDTARPRIEIGGSLDSARAGEGLAAIRAAVQALRDGREFDRQFAFARRNVLKQMLNAQADARLLAGQLAQAVRAGQDAEYFVTLAREVATLEPAEVKAQFERVLRDERSVTLIQGPAEGIQDVIERNEITNAKVLPTVVHDERDD